jgi:hypothetical protein
LKGCPAEARKAVKGARSKAQGVHRSAAQTLDGLQQRRLCPTRRRHPVLSPRFKDRGQLQIDLIVLMSEPLLRWVIHRYNLILVWRPVEARSTLSVAEYQQKFNDNACKDLRLVYLNSYLHGGEINVIAI